MTRCDHRASFASRFQVREFVEKSRIFEAFWKCPACSRWVAGTMATAPLSELTPRNGIFLTKEVAR